MTDESTKPDAVALEELGWDARWEAQAAVSLAAHPGAEVARVAADFGQDLRVIGPAGEERVAIAGRLRFGVRTRPAVGDFVAVAGDPGARVAVDVLARRTWLGRQAAGKRTELQLIAANLDVVFVVTSFNEDFNIRRLERYLVAIADGGAQGVVVLNKADLATATARAERTIALSERLGVPVVATSVREPDGLRALDAWLQPGTTASFVGSSGVGKSSIVNMLLGSEKQTVRAVRESDSRGRHTTTHRELFGLPNGALVIDTPGMREFQLWDDATADAFEDITELAGHCRFRNCQHRTEPGCAVRAAVEDGELSAERLESWRKLLQEGQRQRDRKR